MHPRVIRNMDIDRYSAMLLHFYQTARRHISDDCNLSSHRPESNGSRENQLTFYVTHLFNPRRLNHPPSIILSLITSLLTR